MGAAVAAQIAREGAAAVGTVESSKLPAQPPRQQHSSSPVVVPALAVEGCRIRHRPAPGEVRTAKLERGTHPGGVERKRLEAPQEERLERPDLVLRFWEALAATRTAVTAAVVAAVAGMVVEAAAEQTRTPEVAAAVRASSTPTQPERSSPPESAHPLETRVTLDGERPEVQRWGAL